MSFFTDSSLCLIPSGVKSGKVYSIVPTSGDGDLTFTRASNATRVNSSCLVEKVRENLLTYSNDTSNAAWSRVGALPTSGESGYDGSSDAWLLTATGAGAHYALQSKTDTGILTFSMYAKQGTTKGVRIAINGGGDHWANFNLDTGASAGFAAGVIGQKIEAVGATGWYRISVTANKTTSSGWGAIYILDNSFATSFTAAGETIYIQDAQLEFSDFGATPYIETTSSAVSVGPVSGLPRLDYSGGATCPSLLLEPQRTNLVLSTSFRTGWVFLSGGSMSYNTSVSPDGYTNAETLVGDGVNANAAYTSVNVTSGTLYTYSIFAKANTQSLLRMRGFSVAAGGNINFDLSNGTISGSTTDDDIIRSEIQDYGNGWYRCICVFDADATGSALFGFDRAINASGNLFDVYGPQIEAGGYATSYIPTLSTAVTRVADAASKTGISSLIGQTEGTLFAEFEIGVENTHIFLYTNASNALYIQTAIGDMWRAYVLNGGAYEVAITAGTPPSSGFVKMAFAYKQNDFALYANGTLIGTDTSGSVPACSSLDFGLGPYGVGQFGPKRTNQALVFPTRLSNADLATLTTI